LGLTLLEIWFKILTKLKIVVLFYITGIFYEGDFYMDFEGIILGTIAILSIFIGVPSVIMFFIYKIIKGMKDKEKIKYQKEILELEIEKQRNQIKLLEEENRKYDNIIDNS
jgi:hypothetical protein